MIDVVWANVVIARRPAPHLRKNARGIDPEYPHANHAVLCRGVGKLPPCENAERKRQQYDKHLGGAYALRRRLPVHEVVHVMAPPLY